MEALGHFGVQAKVIGTVAGPHITRYELRLAPGTKVAKVAQLKDDLAYALAATDIRILAPIPGKQAVGVEVPNARRRIVRLGDVFQEPPKDWSPLTVWLGKDVAGKAIGADLAKMPHLLVAGTTGAGKSGAINAMLASVLLRASPHELRLVLVDPKQVELNHYESIPHLLTPVITSPRMAANALQNLVREMEQRYGIMSLARTRSLPELNRHREGRGEPPLPYILCVIDELADLMMVAPADVEDSIIRLAQKARAVGMHLVLATQSPRVDVITGMIKANVPSRIAFAVSSQTDSRVILDQNGAESLLGQGDMLFSPVGTSRLQRIQGAYIDEPQIAKLTDFWRRQGEPELREELLEEVEPAEPEGGAPDEFDPDEDPLLRDAITLVAEMQTASTSMLQRRLRLGYTRAGRLIDMLERRGVISGYEGSKPRQVLVTEADLPRVLAGLEARSEQAVAVESVEALGFDWNPWRGSLVVGPVARGARPAQAGVRGVHLAGRPLAFRIDMPEIGATLREARMRERIDVSEIEAKTKIRAKYLRALENEEWDLLPGPTFVKSFLRTYAQALGLDGKALRRGIQAELRASQGCAPSRSSRLAARPRGASGRAAARRGAATRRAGGRSESLARLPRGGRGRRPADRAADRRPAFQRRRRPPALRRAPGRTRSAGTSGARHVDGARHRVRSDARRAWPRCKLEPTGEVYVCLIGDGGRKRIPGLILKPGAAEPEYHARRFLLTLGNNCGHIARRRQAAHRAGVERGDRLRDHRDRRAPTLASGELPTCRP